MEKSLPTSTPLLPVAAESGEGRSVGCSRRKRVWRLLLATVCLFAVTQWSFYETRLEGNGSAVKVPLHAAEILDKCSLLGVKPGPPVDFNKRDYSDRFVPGTKATLIKVSMGTHSCYVSRTDRVRTRQSGQAS